LARPRANCGSDRVWTRDLEAIDVDTLNFGLGALISRRFDTAAAVIVAASRPGHERG